MPNRDTEILQELRELSPLLAEIPKSNPFVLPQKDWLEGFSEQVAQQLKDEQEITGKESLPSTNPHLYDVPEEFFEHSPASILKRIHANEVQEELVAISSIVEKIEYKQHDDIPEDYFHRFPSMVMRNIQKQEDSNLYTLVFPKKWIRLAIAASLLIALLTIGYKLELRTSSKQEEIVKIVSDEEFEHLLAEIDDESIIEYLQTNGSTMMEDELEPLIDSTNLPKMEEYLDEELSDELFRELESDTNPKTKN